jgi:hypothetical protein
MSNLPLTFRQDSQSEEPQDVVISLITFTHPDLAVPIRISTDPTQRVEETVDGVAYGTISNGETYYFMNAGLMDPAETKEGYGRLEFVFENVTRKYAAIIRTIFGSISMDIDMVMSSDVNTVIKSWPQFSVFNIDSDALQTRLSAKIDDRASEPVPAHSFIPAHHPGLWGR